MDPSLVTSASVLLTASGGDGSFDDGNESAIVPASVTWRPTTRAAPSSIFGGVAGGADSYELG